MADPQKLRHLLQTSNLMTPRQVEIVERDKKNLQQALQGRPMPLYGGDPSNEFRPSAGSTSQAGTVMVMRDTPMPDRELLQRNYEECDRTLGMGTTPALSGAAKNTSYKWFKEELAKFVEGMPSHDQMWRPTWQNLQLYQRHREQNRLRAKFLANAHRAIDPQDEGFHLEGFRPEKPTPFNGRAFREGWDEIQWDDPTELALQVEELDDETYYRFVELKAQGITAQKLYETTLGITPTLYRACEARLKRAMDALVLDAQQAAEAGETPDAAAASEDLTPKEQEALHQYGDGVLAMACETPDVTLDDIKETLRVLVPEGFSTPHMLAQKALATARALVKTGLFVADGEHAWHVKEPSAVSP